MIVNSVSTQTRKYLSLNRAKTPAFKSSHNGIYADNYTLKYYTNTCFFRKDLRWLDFADYIYKKFENVNRVNVIDYACSTGEEPVSLAMALETILGEKAEKFFPIKAYDIEKENIEDAKRGLFKINSGEMDLIKNNLGNKYKNYCSEVLNSEGNVEWLSSKPNLESKIIYNQSDLRKDVSKLPKGNAIFICKNLFPYLSIGETKSLVKEIANRLKAPSVVVLGSFDISYGIEKLFHKKGFVSTMQYNVLEKLPYHKYLYTNLLQKLKIK